MANDVDHLSDAAMGASKLAMVTHADDHHKNAKACHEEAYKAASAAARPSLAQHHLQQAAMHDQHADPTTALGKGAVARRATDKARASGKLEDHDAAALAHKDAAQAHLENGGHKLAMTHHDMANQHEFEAAKMRQPKQPQPIG